LGDVSRLAAVDYLCYDSESESGYAFAIVSSPDTTFGLHDVIPVNENHL
jgi:hypothetical protein